MSNEIKGVTLEIDKSEAMIFGLERCLNVFLGGAIKKPHDQKDRGIWRLTPNTYKVKFTDDMYVVFRLIEEKRHSLVFIVDDVEYK